MVVPVDIKRKQPPPVSPPLDRTRDGTGWVTTCPICFRSRVIGRQAIMSGAWLRCPFCEQEETSCE
jgi:hypothetical protein